jgi:hypothetical protein
MTSKCTRVAENVYAPLVMVPIGARKRTLAGQTVYKNESIDTSFDPPLFSLDSTFKHNLGHFWLAFLKLTIEIRFTQFELLSIKNVLEGSSVFLSTDI